MSKVPQGYVLGPILFNLCINDIKVGINSSLSVLVDDTKLSRVITSQQDIAALQGDNDKIKGWATAWQMRFIIDNHKVINLETKHMSASYMLGGEPLQGIKDGKDLRVLVHHKPSNSI